MKQVKAIRESLGTVQSFADDAKKRYVGGPAVVDDPFVQATLSSLVARGIRPQRSRAQPLPRSPAARCGRCPVEDRKIPLRHLLNPDPLEMGTTVYIRIDF